MLDFIYGEVEDGRFSALRRAAAPDHAVSAALVRRGPGRVTRLAARRAQRAAPTLPVRRCGKARRTSAGNWQNTPTFSGKTDPESRLFSSRMHAGSARHGINDATVAGMLTMLDAIHVSFSDVPCLMERLEAEDCPIRFHFARLSKLGNSADDIFITMNARGKQLTEWEHFKAQVSAVAQGSIPGPRPTTSPASWTTTGSTCSGAAFPPGITTNIRQRPPTSAWPAFSTLSRACSCPARNSQKATCSPVRAPPFPRADKDSARHATISNLWCGCWIRCTSSFSRKGKASLLSLSSSFPALPATRLPVPGKISLFNHGTADTNLLRLCCEGTLSSSDELMLFGRLMGRRPAHPPGQGKKTAAHSAQSAGISFSGRRREPSSRRLLALHDLLACETVRDGKRIQPLAGTGREGKSLPSGKPTKTTPRFRTRWTIWRIIQNRRVFPRRAGRERPPCV